MCMRDDASRRACAAFSMIELLVILAIIAILLVLLLPSLQSSRAAARAVICSSNLKQIHVAATLYHSDERDIPLPSYYDHIPFPFKYWPEFLNNYLNQDLYAGGTLESYAQLPQVMVCPEAREWYPSMYWNTGIPTTYQYARLEFTPWARRTFTVMGRIRHADSMVAFNDAIGNRVTGAFNYNAWAKDQVDAANILDFRHRTRATMAFVDGHVKLHGIEDVANYWDPRDGIVWRAFAKD